MSAYVAWRTSSCIRAFTLLEVLICSTLAMSIVAFATVTFFKMRQAINRAEALMALSQEAQSIYMALHDSFACAQQSGAVVGITLRSDPSLDPDPGSVSLIFLRANMNSENFVAQNDLLQTYNSSQLVWEEWQWRKSSRCLYSAVNRPMRRNHADPMAREFIIPSSFKPNNGADYNQRRFMIVPQPRRYLDPAHPTGPPDPSDPTISRLDDNMWFPDTSSPGYPNPPYASKLAAAPYNIREDLGDFSDLQQALAPSFYNLSDFSLQIIPHDESIATTTLDAGTSATMVWQGVWLDGRLGAASEDRSAASLQPPHDFHDATNPSDAARRPKLIRLRFVLTDAKVKVSQNFLFSFAWPALAPKS